MSIYDNINLPCGAVARFSHESGYGYRCTRCGAVVRSIAMPEKCREALDLYDAEGETAAKLTGTKYVQRF